MRRLIKDKQLVDDNWQYVADDAPLPAGGDICLSFERWRQAGADCPGHDGRLGIRLKPGDDLGAIADHLPHIALVELDFPKFNDGRLFSMAWLLRGRYGFGGEIRAVGDFIPDQAFYLARVGVNAFAPDDPERLPAIIGHLADFSAAYQPSANPPQ